MTRQRGADQSPILAPELEGALRDLEKVVSNDTSAAIERMISPLRESLTDLKDEIDRIRTTDRPTTGSKNHNESAEKREPPKLVQARLPAKLTLASLEAYLVELGYSVENKRANEGAFWVTWEERFASIEAELMERGIQVREVNYRRRLGKGRWMFIDEPERLS